MPWLDEVLGPFKYPVKDSRCHVVIMNRNRQNGVFVGRDPFL